MNLKIKRSTGDKLKKIIQKINKFSYIFGVFSLCFTKFKVKRYKQRQTISVGLSCVSFDSSFEPLVVSAAHAQIRYRPIRHRRHYLFKC